MSFNATSKILAGAIALAISGGAAMANTSLDVAGTGDVFINLVDTTNNTGFVFDTSLSQAAFNLNGSYTFNFATDPNYTAFVSGEGSKDVITYSVFSGTKTTTSPAVGTLLFSSNAGPGAVAGAAIQQSLNAAGGFATGANAVTSSTTNSALLGSFNNWNGGATPAEGTIDTQLAIPYGTPGGINALVGNALKFYSESSNALRSNSTAATLTLAAGTWNYSNGIATYGSTSAVPLPTPVLLLLSGLGLMGVVSRRGKGSSAV